jgi:small subunit ribosomal protein S5
MSDETKQPPVAEAMEGKDNNVAKEGVTATAAKPTVSYGDNRFQGGRGGAGGNKDRRGGGGRGGDRRGPKREEKEFDQKVIDLARVTRVMAGGKRMRFRACMAIGDRKGKVAVGLAKGADVTLAIAKAINNAKKKMITIPTVKDTIPHEIFHKFGATKIILKPAVQGRGLIAGGPVRIILELGGVKNITSKIIGGGNKVNIAKCTVEALAKLVPGNIRGLKLKKSTSAKIDDSSPTLIENK